MALGDRSMTSRDKCNMIETKPALNDDLLVYIRDKIDKCPVVTICPVIQARYIVRCVRNVCYPLKN